MGCCRSKRARRTWKAWGSGYYEIKEAREQADKLRKSGKYARVLLTDKTVRDGKTYVKINTLAV